MILGLITAFILTIGSILVVHAIVESKLCDNPKIAYCAFFGGVCITVGLYLLIIYF